MVGSRWRRLVESQLVVDESWAIAQRDGGMDRHLLIGAGAALWCSWVGGTVVGLLAGDLIADPERLGLDAAFPALFLALLVPQLRTRTRLAAALAGGALAVGLATVAIKASGPVVLGDRPLPAWLRPARASRPRPAGRAGGHGGAGAGRPPGGRRPPRRPGGCRRGHRPPRPHPGRGRCGRGGHGAGL